MLLPLILLTDLATATAATSLAEVAPYQMKKCEQKFVRLPRSNAGQAGWSLRRKEGAAGDVTFLRGFSFNFDRFGPSIYTALHRAISLCG